MSSSREPPETPEQEHVAAEPRSSKLGRSVAWTGES